MKAKKMIYSISVFGMLTAFLVGGTGNLYAQSDSEQKLQRLDSMVADLSLSQTQKDKYAQFKSSLDEKAATEKDMEFVNKLINVMSF